MKLRNKKTGEIARRIDISANGEIIWVFDELHPIKYERLKDLIEDWEDYEEKEPLIKDEKIRKSVRLWSEHYDNECIRVHIGEEYITLLKDDINGFSSSACIDLSPDVFEGMLVDDEYYTIAELCGDEE